MQMEKVDCVRTCVFNPLFTIEHLIAKIVHYCECCFMKTVKLVSIVL